jgi:hypothetical protein
MGLERADNWEYELWSLISSGDGDHCPLYDGCEIRLQSGQCLVDSSNYLYDINKLIDNDELDLSNSSLNKLELITCARAGKIFQLVDKLAQKYIKMGNVNSPPVPAELINLCDKSRTIEIREVPLKAYHGAIWRTRDSWIVHLNRNDSLAGKRFSLFHEAFHILAHGQASPVFRKVGIKGGSFNELLANHFAGCILMPSEWAREKWAEVHDLDKMSEIFQLPKPVVWLGLTAFDLL